MFLNPWTESYTEVQPVFDYVYRKFSEVYSPARIWLWIEA
jgi:hypothetical protein